MVRIGSGFDVHRFGAPTEVSRVVLGGVSIPFERPLLAHSDGDVLIHAACDALLGALALGDIGHHFPDTDPAYKNADSRLLLREVCNLLKEAGYGLNNLDATIIAEAPKMAPHIDAMRSNLAADLQVEVGAISVKATTTEGLGFTGRGEGIACQVVALLQPLA